MFSGLLEKMFTALNAEGSCTIPVTEATTIYLKVFPPSVDPPVVHDHDVPILTIDKEDVDLTDWDLTTQQVRLVAKPLNTKN